MRMDSPQDIEDLAHYFGYAPTELLRRASVFNQGQSLRPGHFVAEPSIIQMGARLTREGGSDIPAPLR